MRLAAIDCGTHSIRLLVGDVGVGGVPVVEVHREMRIVGLGEGVDSTGHLSDAALERTFRAVEDYAAVIERLGVQRVRMVATSASRDADNFADFAVGVSSRLGVSPQVISGDEEATLSFLGTVSSHGFTCGWLSPVLVVDIGGGSTEFALGMLGGDAHSPARLTESISMNMGSTRVTERFLRPSEDAAGVPGETAIEAANDFVDGLIGQASSRVPLVEAREVVGVAGSVTTLTALALGLEDYDAARINGAVVDSSRLCELAGELIRSPRVEKTRLGPVHPQRVDQISGGVLVWQRILRFLESQPVSGGSGRVRGSFPVRTSENDILDGVLLSMF